MTSDTRTHRAASLQRLVEVVAVLVVTTFAGQANAQRIDYTGSLQSATGKYLFTERTTSLAWSNGLSLEVGRVRLTATLPLLYQNSTAVTYVGGTPVPTGGPDAELVRQRQGGTRIPMGPGGKRRDAHHVASIAATTGETSADVVAQPGDFETNLGDPLLQMDIEAYRSLGALRSFSLNVVAKAPVADVESGIGTGEWDYGAGAMFSLGSGRTYFFANATYWVLGDMPDLPLKNTVSYGASLGRALGATARWSLLGTVMGSTAVIETSDPPLAVGASVGYLWKGGDGLNLGLMFGLTESSPDVSTYLGWRVPLGGRQ